jgi:threonylcarbamoyladenosine tRNA methylthiotransferase MtaB
LVALLKKLLILSRNFRIRLSSIELNEVSDELIRLVKNNHKICRHFHIPLQSGSDKLLRLMNRPYSRALFAGKIKKIRRALPLVGITTDVIVGFPGEGEAEFAQTLEFIKRLRFSRLHVFPYSEHEMTPAAKLPGKVAGNVILNRAKILRDLSIELERNFRNKFAGREVEIIIENSRQGRTTAKTSEYVEIAVPAKIKAKTGQLVKIKI